MARRDRPDYDWTGFFRNADLGTDPANWGGSIALIGPENIALLPGQTFEAYDDTISNVGQYANFIRSIGQIAVTGDGVMYSETVLDFRMYWTLRFVRDVRAYLPPSSLPAEPELGGEDCLAFGQIALNMNERSLPVFPVSTYELTGGDEWDISSTRVVDELGLLVFEFNIVSASEDPPLANSALSVIVRGRNLMRKD